MIKNVKTNKSFLARFGSNNSNNSQQKKLSNNEIVIKCINELPSSKPSATKPPTVYNLNLKNNLVEREDDAKENEEIEPPLVSKNAEISIISHHSSMNNLAMDLGIDDLSSSKSNIEILKDSPLINAQEPTTKDPSIVNIFAGDHELISDDKLDQGIEDIQSQLISNTDVNISQYDVTGKSRARSQFMQKFASVPKRHVVPQVIEHSSMSEIDEDSRKCHQTNSPNFENLTTSLAASLAVSATQPFLKVQNELENKLNAIVKQLEGLKKNPNEDFERDKTHLEDEISKITDMRLKYIEGLQEKQFALITHLIAAMNAGNNANGQQAVNRLIEDYKNELRSVHDENMMRLNDALDRSNNLRPRTPSKGKKGPKSEAERKKSRSRSALGCRRHLPLSRSGSPVKDFEPEFGCLQCSIDKLEGNVRPVKGAGGDKKKFLEELLDGKGEQVAEERKYERDRETVVKKAPVRPTEPVFDLGNHQSLFDKYLSELRSADKETLNFSSVKINQAKTPQKRGLFGDIEDALKECESSKKRLENNIKTMERNSDSKFFDCIAEVTSTNQTDIEKIRIKKIVDGYVDAISVDVQKEVLQDMIDQSRRVKLEAEKEEAALKEKTSSRVRSQTRSSSAKPVTTAAPPKKVNPANKLSAADRYFISIYGREAFDKLKKKEEAAKNPAEANKIPFSKGTTKKAAANAKAAQQSKAKEIEAVPQTEQRTLSEDVFDRIISQPFSFPYERPKINIVAPPAPPQRPIIDAKKEVAQPTGIKIERGAEAKPKVALITIKKDEVPKKANLTKRDLPAVNISSHIESEKEIGDNDRNVRVIEEANETKDDDFDKCDGVGIIYPGYVKPKPKPNDKARSIVNSNENRDRISHIVQPSSDEIAERLKSKDLLENKALDWIEQEVIARFVNLFAEPNNVAKDPVVEASMSDNQNESSDQIITITEDDEEMMVPDFVTPKESDLIEALVVEELRKMIKAQVDGENLDESLSQRQRAPQPQPRAFERNSNENMMFKVPTPIPTPVNSPPSSPRAQRVRTPPLTPRESIIVETNNLPAPEPQKPAIQVIEVDEETSSLLQTLEQDEGEEVELTIDPRMIVIPKTPQETPRQSPSPPSTPVPSEPIVVVKEKPKEKPNLVSISIQVEPERVKPVEVPKVVPKEVRVPSPPPVKPAESDDESLTASTSYSDDQSTTTHSQNNDIETSYMSEGAWLISKSEGQIIQLNNNDTGSLVGNGVFTEASASEGEIKINGVYQRALNRQASNGNTNNGKASYSRHLSDGEIGMRASVNGVSEGEVEQGENRRLPFSQNGHSRHHKARKSKEEKTVVNLRANDKQKNSIRIQPIANEINLRDSKDFERKIFSSTPDSSHVFSSGGNRVELPHEIADYRISNANSYDFNENYGKNESKKITISMPKPYDSNSFNEENDHEDTFSNVSDMKD